MPEPRDTFVLLDDDGNLQAIAGPLPEWIDNFAQHHRLRSSAIYLGRLDTAFLGRGRLDGERVTGAFESVFADRDGIEKVVHRCDTLAEALGFHDRLVREWGQALKAREKEGGG